jgi:hypothetical protein
VLGRRAILFVAALGQCERRRKRREDALNGEAVVRANADMRSGEARRG